MYRSVDGGDHPAGVGAVEREMPSLWRTIFKNLLAVGVAGCIWLALQTGYISPDRPTRPQWERIEDVKSKSGGHVVYQSDFRHDLPKADTGTRPAWGRYNGATTEHVSFDPDGVTIHSRPAITRGERVAILFVVPDTSRTQSADWRSWNTRSAGSCTRPRATSVIFAWRRMGKRKAS